MNLLSFHLLFSRKTIDMDSANIYYFLNTIINSFLYWMYHINGNLRTQSI